MLLASAPYIGLGLIKFPTNGVGGPNLGSFKFIAELEGEMLTFELTTIYYRCSSRDGVSTSGFTIISYALLFIFAVPPSPLLYDKLLDFGSINYFLLMFFSD